MSKNPGELPDEPEKLLALIRELVGVAEENEKLIQRLQWELELLKEAVRIRQARKRRRK